MPQIILDGKYRLDERLGEGASGVVYRALHLGLKKSFAVKLLKTDSPDPLSLARFRREAEALGQLRHPHVVEVTDFGIDAAAGIPYLVMELLEGTTLADFCRQHGPLPLARALALLEAIAEAVDAAHTQGVLHRDLKPGNILLCPTAEGEPLVKVLDFGLAEIPGLRPAARKGSLSRRGEDLRLGGDVAACDHLTSTGSLLGTPLYVAPELIRQQAASRASDLYSFGVIAYELLAGHPPFQGSTAEVLAGHLVAEPPVPRPAGAPLPKEVWEVLQEPLRKNPALRPTSASDIVRRARRAVERTVPKPWWVTRIPRRAGLSIGLMMIVLLAGLVLPWSMLLWTEQWLQDLVARSMPAQAPEPRSSLPVKEASLEEGAPSSGHPSRRPAGLGGHTGGSSNPPPVVSILPAGEPSTSGITLQKLVNVDGGQQAPGAKGGNDEGLPTAGDSSRFAALQLNGSASPRNSTAPGPAPPPVDRVRSLKIADLLGYREDLDALFKRDSAKPVALIYALEGEAALTAPPEKRKLLRLFDRLPARTLVEVGPDSRLALAFADGHRYEFGARSRAILGPADLSGQSGPVRPLPEVPPLPCLVPEFEVSFGANCLRWERVESLRDEKIAGLHPHCGISILAGAITLRFEPIEGREIYRVELYEHERNVMVSMSQGDMVFAVETTTSAATLPLGILQPGLRYQWTVRTLVGSLIKGEAEFIALPLQAAEAREALRRAVEKEGSTDSLALLAEVDRCLGLLPEARNELREVVRGSTGTTALYHLGAMEADLGELTSAEEHLQRALASQEALKPGSIDVADILKQLGILAWKRGDLQAAEAFHRRALEIKEKLAQGSLQQHQ